MRRLWRLFRFLWWMFPYALRAQHMARGDRGGIKRVSYFTRDWGKFLVKNFGMEIEFECDHPIEEGALIVSNHQSYLDIFAHASLFPIRFTPKVELSRWPVLGWYCGVSRPVWVDRKTRQKSKETLDEFRRTLEDGISLLVYPEGTTTDGLHGMLPFKSTPFETVAGTKFAIQPIITRYVIEKGGWNPAWYGDMTLLPHLWKMMGQKAIRMKIVALPLMYSEPDEDRKALAARVEKAMLEAWERLA